MWLYMQQQSIEVLPWQMHDFKRNRNIKKTSRKHCFTAIPYVPCFYKGYLTATEARLDPEGIVNHKENSFGSLLNSIAQQYF